MPTFQKPVNCADISYPVPSYITIYLFFSFQIGKKASEKLVTQSLEEDGAVGENAARGVYPLLRLSVADRYQLRAGGQQRPHGGQAARRMAAIIAKTCRYGTSEYRVVNEHICEPTRTVTYTTQVPG